MGHQRRDLTKSPQIDNQALFAEQWGDWWAGLQPDWRVKDQNGRLSRSGTGDWEALHKPGKGGFLLVLLCLMWWREAQDSPEAAWDAAVEDVAWVLESMVAAGKPNEGDAESQDPPQRTRKRTRGPHDVTPEGQPVARRSKRNQ